MWNARNPLTTRWTPAERKAINRAFSRGAYRFLDDLPTVRHGNVKYVDLRGFPLEAQILVDLTRVDLADCDMQLGGVGREIKLTQCLFRGARLWTTLGYDVRRCDFTGAQMKGVDLRGTYRDCTFADANLVGARNYTNVSRFVRCDFSGARLRKVALTDAEFDHCTWTGVKFGGMASFVGSRFIGSRPTPEQLGDSMMETDEAERELERQIESEVEAEFRRRAAEKGWRTRRRKIRSRSPGKRRRSVIRPSAVA